MKYNDNKSYAKRAITTHMETQRKQILRSVTHEKTRSKTVVKKNELNT